MIPDDLYAGTHRSQYDPDCSPRTRREGCVPGSGANGARAATGGRVDKLVSEVHALVAQSEETSPTKPGWSLRDLELAMSRLGVPFERRQGTWAAVVAAHDAGLFVVLQGDSDQFANGTCSGVFDGDHCVGIHPGTYLDGTYPLADPICRQRRPEQPSVLRDYATKFAAHVAGRPTSVISFGVFPDPVPLEDDMGLDRLKGEDWRIVADPTGKKPYRAKPDRGVTAAGYLTSGSVVRTVGEVTNAQGSWRVTRISGATVYLLRRGTDGKSDIDPLVPGGDPATDAAFTSYIDRTPAPLPDCSAEVLAARHVEYARVKGGTTIAFPEPPA